MIAITAIIVITIITRRVTGKVIPNKSIPPRIQEGAVTSTFLALALPNLLIAFDNPFAARIPRKADIAQVPICINLSRF